MSSLFSTAQYLGDSLPGAFQRGEEDLEATQFQLVEAEDFGGTRRNVSPSTNPISNITKRTTPQRTNFPPTSSGPSNPGQVRGGDPSQRVSADRIQVGSGSSAISRSNPPQNQIPVTPTGSGFELTNQRPLTAGFTLPSWMKNPVVAAVGLTGLVAGSYFIIKQTQS
ncbi:MAG: hypothetical protein AAFW89_12965 [Bacteroidota bacterium]